MPWEADGPKWHTKDRVTTTGKPMKWDGEALESVIQQIHDLGTFPETNWNHRSVVEIALTEEVGWLVPARHDRA